MTEPDDPETVENLGMGLEVSRVFGGVDLLEAEDFGPRAMGPLLQAWNTGVSHHTVRARLGDLRSFAAFLGLAPTADLGAWALVADGPVQARKKVRAWDEWASHQGHAPTTRSRRLTSMRSLVTEAQAHGLPWGLVGVRSPKWDPYDKASGPDPASVEKVIAELEERGKHQHRAVLLLLYDGGLRADTVVRLRSRDLVQEQPHPMILVRLKGDRQKFKRISRRAFEACKRIAPDDKDGSIAGLTYRGVYSLIERLGLGSPHGLRHSAATVLADRTGNVRLVQAFLEHKHVSTSQIYIDRVRDEAGIGSEIVAGEHQERQET